jgi:hypothetical protein
MTRKVMTQNMREGLFTYTRADNGQSETVDLYALGGGMTPDPWVQSQVALTPLSNDLTSTDPNLQRFRFNSAAPTDRESWTVRTDYNHNQNHRFEIVWQQMNVDFPNFTPGDAGETFPGLPGMGSFSTRQRLATAWHSNYGPNLTNEARFGFQRAPVKFINSETFEDGFILNGQALLFDGPTNPVRVDQDQGRNSPAFDWINNVSWLRVNHVFKFGGSYRYYWSDPFNDRDIIPTYFPGWGIAGSPLSQGQFPGGIGDSDLTRARGYLALLTGTVYRAGQRFNVTSRDSGFVSDAGEERKWKQGVLSFFFADTWRLKPTFTLNLGLRWEYYNPVNEADGLALLPQGHVLDPDTLVDFAGGDSRSLYNSDWNNFAPSIGLAWDPFGDGKTSLRAGYSISYVIDSNLSMIKNAVSQNRGLSVERVLPISGTVSGGAIKPIAPPEFKLPRSQLDNLADDPLSPLFTIDQAYATPYVQQWSLSLERRVTRETVVEIRYVGNRGTKLARAIDLNQVNPFGEGGTFLDDFKAAQRNLENNGDPYVGEDLGAFNLLGGLPGQPGFLNAFRSALLTGQIGGLINAYLNNRDFLFVSTDPSRPGGERFGAQVTAGYFMPNGNIGPGDVVGNNSWSTYHALQAEVRRQFRNGLTFQGNYTYAKNLTDFPGSGLNFNAYMDTNQRNLEKRRSPQDITHVFNANWIYELPFGPGRSFLSGGGIPAKILGGWQIGGILNWQSGKPLSIVSLRGTYNFGWRSHNNTPLFTGLTIPELQSKTGNFRLPDGRVSLFDPSILKLSGGTVRPSDQYFNHPGAGEFGNLALTPVSGPQFLNLDFSLIKRTPVSETVNVEFRAEFFNILNRTNFDFDNTQWIDSNNFGVIHNTFPARIIQLALRVNF